MTYFIDQSGKIEDTAKDTVLAAVNENDTAVILSAKDKRRLQENFRILGKPQLFVDAVFAAVLHFLVKKLTRRGRICVDIEYPGHTKIIEKIVNQLADKDVGLEWVLVGKSSRAHDVAYKVFKKKLKMGKKLTAVEIWNQANKIAGGRLNAGLSPANRRSAPAADRTIAELRKKSRRKRSSFDGRELSLDRKVLSHGQ